MPTRSWMRHYAGNTFTPPDAAAIASPYLLQTGQGSEDQDSTLVRQILDLWGYARVQVNGSVSIPPEWWDQITITAGVGVDAAGSTAPLHLAGLDDDTRITGTAVAFPQYGGTSRQTGWEQAFFRLPAILDVKGMRKTPVPGATPLSNLTIQVQGASNVFETFSNWTLVLSAYWRVLWETP